MTKITFRQINSESGDDELFHDLLKEYFDEMDEEEGNQLIPDDIMKKLSAGMIRMQGPKDRHLEIIYLDKKPIGFLYGKIDHEDHRGFVKPGYGYIMEFYLKQEFRRNGFGRDSFGHLQKLFKSNGAKKMYLTSREGKAMDFWKCMGFAWKNEISSENDLKILEKTIK